MPAKVAVNGQQPRKYYDGIDNPNFLMRVVENYSGVLSVAPVIEGNVTIRTDFKDEVMKLDGIDIKAHLRTTALRAYTMLLALIGIWLFFQWATADQYHPYSMGETAENVARQWKVSREDQDAFAVASHQKAAKAIAAQMAPCSVYFTHSGAPPSG